MEKEEDREGDERIQTVMVTSYWMVMPILVVMGVIVNSLGLYLLRQPKIRALPATTYFVVLLSLDVVILLVSISTIITLNGCHLHSYKNALYFAHPCFTFFYMLQTFSHYIIVWVCYDRYQALWCPHYFQQTQQHRIIWIRVIVTGFFCVIVNLRHLLDVSVECIPDAGVVEDSNHTQDCEGAWIIKDSLHMTEVKTTWQYVVRVVRGLLVIVMPVVLVLVLNFGIVVGLVRHRIQNIAATPRTRDQAYSCIYITLAISFTAIATAMPTVIHATFFATNIKTCHGPYKEEVFRAAAHLLLLAEHLTHFLILAFYQTFRWELKKTLHNVKVSLTNTQLRLWGTNGLCHSQCLGICSIKLSHTEMHKIETVSNNYTSATINPRKLSVPKVKVYGPEDQPEADSSNGEVVTHANMPLSFLNPTVELERIREERRARESYASELEKISATTSVLTVNEDEVEET